ncbi:ZZ-type zinc finger-containing protein 3 isoform X2 [Amia ocellicauda]|uniref:ZZ-type zinc finger-containing protein 3 isoform X2 n=1 Tax=Amia ocellicauda TaxID=2972642 RepID=UPI003464C8EA
MAASRSTRVTRSSVGINGLDENFCGRTLRNRSIAHPEDSLPNTPQRARSPKKKQDCQQLPAKGNNSGKLDLKQTQGTREPWMSPRKRGLSCSEKDFPDKTENCERRPSREVSPVLKRIRRCSRPGEVNSSEEDSPVKPEKPACDSKETVGENDEDSSGPKRARRCLLLDDCDKGEIKKVDSPADRNDQSMFSDEAHQITNGLNEQDLDDVKNCTAETLKPNQVGSCESTEEICTVPVSTRNKSVSLLNGSKVDSALDPDVPCRNSHSEQTEPDAQRTTESTSSTVVENDHSQQPSVVSSLENASSIREPEEEVDVVGDSGCSSRECVVQNTNGGLCAVQDNKPISGEPEPPLGLDCSPTEVASFMEPQEHRYTLRTSPRRAAGSKGSPHKLSSPSRDNGPVKEEDKESTESRNLPSDSKADDEPCAKTEEVPCAGQGTSSDNASQFSGDMMAKLTGESGLSDSRLLRSTKELVSSHAATEEDEDEEDPDVYYFESDHLALKHNKDYQRLLQTIAVLEAQRTQAVMDLESLARCQKEALSNPIGFVEQLQKQESMGLPCPQRVVQLPDIAWDQYTSGLGDFEREFRKKRNTRRLKLIFDKVGLPSRPKSPLDSKKEGETSAMYSALPSSDAPQHTASSSRSQMIRGRICDQNKPDTFNQLWTVEEQKKLEQLLLKFPPEEVESKRWQKIADELGNRTAKQVASRVQKYFIKLTKAGIPVPGRTPNLCMYSKKASSKRQHHLNKHLYRPSTFMTSYEPPVYMDDDDDRSSYCSNQQDAAAEDSDEESIPVEYRHLPEYKELLQLKKMKKQKLQEIHAESIVQHVGFKCDNCGVDPIPGVRLHCQDCPPENSVDLCGNCSDCLLKTEIHKPDHHLEPVYRAETFLDRDYCMPQTTGYNYLDPNYFPANR